MERCEVGYVLTADDVGYLRELEREWRALRDLVHEVQNSLLATGHFTSEQIGWENLGDRITEMFSAFQQPIAKPLTQSERDELQKALEAVQNGLPRDPRGRVALLPKGVMFGAENTKEMDFVSSDAPHIVGDRTADHLKCQHCGAFHSAAETVCFVCSKPLDK